jgi:hypothetical protein
MCVRRSRLLRVSLAHGFALALFGLVSGPPGVARAQVPTEVAVYEDGQTTRRVRAAEAGREGLTLLDLRDDWAPRPFAASDGHTDGPSYRAPFVALANGQLGSGPEAVRPLYDRHLELHGIPPALTLLRARLEDTERHRCRDAVDDTALQAMTGVQRPFEDVGRQRAAGRRTSCSGHGWSVSASARARRRSRPSRPMRGTRNPCGATSPNGSGSMRCGRCRRICAASARSTARRTVCMPA